MTHERELRFQATKTSGEVSALLCLPPDAWCLYVFGHGAGAGMRHGFMEKISHDLAGLGIGTFRYQFPYMEAGRKLPDLPAIANKTVRSAVAAAAKAGPGLPLFAGGKSFGGRMTSQAASSEPLASVRGLAFFGFPLHPPKKPGISRAEHLSTIKIPMLFLQGTRDHLAQLDLLGPVCEELGALSHLHLVEGGDHSFKVLKRSRRSEADVFVELTGTLEAFCRETISACGARKE